MNVKKASYAKLLAPAGMLVAFVLLGSCSSSGENNAGTPPAVTPPAPSTPPPMPTPPNPTPPNTTPPNPMPTPPNPMPTPPNPMPTPPNPMPTPPNPMPPNPMPPNPMPMPPAAGSAPCSTEPAAMAPALKRSAPISIPNGGQTGQVVGVPGENVLYVVGHTNGRVHVVKDGMATGMSLVNPPLSVSGGAGGPEAGFLSIALHPKFSENKLFYVFYTGNPGGRTVVDEYERTGEFTSTKKRNVYDRARANGGPFHNGGSIYFSPKDAKPFIYLSIGDHQSPGTASGANGVAGRVLKIDVELGMMGVTTAAHGLRNPYRMSIDRLTGDLWIGDVAQGQGGAVKFKAGTAENTPNFGWTGGEVPGGISGLQGGGAAIIGGVVYRGNKIPGLCGRYFFAMHSSGQVRSLIQQGGTRMGGIVTHGELTVPGRISSFGEDGEGEIWMSSMQQNAIFKIEAAGGN
jgi:glucose/arabinose dehydrogenase